MKKTIEYNERVEVFLRDHSQAGVVVNQILRHIDNVDSVRVAISTRDVCSYCGAAWDPVNEDNCNDCCDEEVAEWEDETNALIDKQDK